MPRIWQDNTGLPISAANLNALEADVQTALSREPAIAAGTTAQYLRGDKSWQTLNAAAVGLGNANNTSDLNKPISTLVQAALDGKVNKSTAPVNVMDYGAVGNNSADDTLAFQAAIDATPVGGVLFIPAGSSTYKITGTLNINKAMTVFNVGGRLNYTSTTGPLIKITVSDVSLINLVANGVGVAGTRVDGANAVLVDGTLASLLNDVRVQGCKFTGFADSGIWMEYVNRAKVIDNHVIDVLYAGIMMLTAVDSEINFNVVSNVVQKAPVVNTYGIALSDWDNTVAARSRNCIIMGNTIRDVPDWEGIDTHGGENITVIGNNVRRCGKGIAMVAGNPSRVTAPTNCTVIGNTIDAGTISNPVVGIFLAGVDATILASANITGNTIVGYPSGAGLSRTFVDAANSAFGSNQGSGQRAPYSMATGNVSIGAVAANGGLFTVAVTFPTGRFTSTPFIQVSSDSTRLTTAFSNVSTTGFTFQASNWTTGNASSATVGHWVATQV